MPFTPSFGTGFEQGSISICAYYIQSVSTNYKHTGSYALFIDEGNENNSYADFPWVPDASSSIYVGFWAYVRSTQTNAVGFARFRFTVGGTAAYIEVRVIPIDSTHDRWSAYVNNGLVASGSIVVNRNEWHHVQIYVSSANSGGKIQTKIDGVADIDYTGDTEPAGGSTISLLQTFRLQLLSGASTNGTYVDDLVIGSGDWPGDWRFDVLVPNGDSAVTWDPSTGSNYACIDEVPPSDTDYVSTGVDAEVDKYTLGDWTGTDKSPQIVTLWARAKKDDASGSTLSLLIDDGTEDIEAGQDLSTAYAYYHNLWLAPPSGGSWADATIDALLAGVKANITA